MKKEHVIYQAKVILRGLVRTVWGMATAGIIWLSVYGFLAVPNESGYAAVGDFVLASSLLSLAMVSVYVQGMGSFRKARS